MSASGSIYGNLATLVVVAHVAFLMFVTVGGLLVLRWPRVAWVHIPCLVWGGYVELGGRVCPLTPLENRLRRMAGDSTYAGGFIENYLLAVLYPQGLTRTIQIVLGVGLVVLNVGIYAWVLHRRREVEDMR